MPDWMIHWWIPSVIIFAGLSAVVMLVGLTLAAARELAGVDEPDVETYLDNWHAVAGAVIAVPFTLIVAVLAATAWLLSKHLKNRHPGEDNDD